MYSPVGCVVWLSEVDVASHSIWGRNRGWLWSYGRVVADFGGDLAVSTSAGVGGCCGV